MTTPRYKAVLFDLDGTLMDTGPGIYAAFRYVQQTMGWRELSEAELHALVGPPLVDSYVNTFHLTPEEGAKAAVMHRTFQIKESYKLSTAYLGIKSLLKDLKRHHVNEAVTTLKGETIAKKTLSVDGLDRYLSPICGVTEAGANPTKADIVRRALKTLDCAPEEAVLVGDSHFDAIGANTAGVDFIAVTYGYGFGDDDPPEKYHPLAICPSTDDLRQLLSHLTSNH